MSQNIHIALVGETKEPILIGTNIYGSVDKVFLLHSDSTKNVAERIRSALRAFSLNDVYFRRIDPFSNHTMRNIVDTV